MINSQIKQKSDCTDRNHLTWIVNSRLPCAQKRWNLLPIKQQILVTLINQHVQILKLYKWKKC